MSTEMTKPFSTHVNAGEHYKELIVAEGQSAMVKPFITKDTPNPKKLYLVLKYYSSREDNVEDYRSFEFYKGTSQDLYDHLKTDILTHDELDVMRSRVLVDSPTVTISRKCTIYMFMRDMRNSGRIIDDTSFDIEEYHYDENDVERDKDEQE